MPSCELGIGPCCLLARSLRHKKKAAAKRPKNTSAAATPMPTPAPTESPELEGTDVTPVEGVVSGRDTEPVAVATKVVDDSDTVVKNVLADTMAVTVRVTVACPLWLLVAAEAALKAD